MKHRVAERKLGVTTSHRRAMLANLAQSLILHDRIETTLTRAKELRRVAEKLVTMGKKRSVFARRRAFAVIRNGEAVKRLFDNVAVRFAGRHGGYTRIYKLGWRHGDCAPMAAIEFLPSEKMLSDEVKASDARAEAKKKAETKKKTAPAHPSMPVAPKEEKKPAKREGAIAKLRASVAGRKIRKRTQTDK